jgi:hypothetical protein
MASLRLPSVPLEFDVFHLPQLQHHFVDLSRYIAKGTLFGDPRGGLLSTHVLRGLMATETHQESGATRENRSAHGADNQALPPRSAATADNSIGRAFMALSGAGQARLPLGIRRSTLSGGTSGKAAAESFFHPLSPTTPGRLLHARPERKVTLARYGRNS